MKAELLPENGDPPIPIVKDLTVIGRRDYCDVRVDHHSLSKRHCVLVRTDGLLVIRDLATTNGTKVKGQKVRWAALLPDDRIALGGYKLRVYLGPDDVPAPSERRRNGQTAAASSAVPPAAVDAPGAGPAMGFPVPTPLGTPALALDAAGGDDEGWERLIASRVQLNDDLVIDLE